MVHVSSSLQASQLRHRLLREAVALHQFQTDANDMEAWILETLRRVSSPEVGRDEFSTQALARKQREVEEEIQSHRTLIDSLQEQAAALPPAHANSPQVSTAASQHASMPGTASEPSATKGQAKR